MKLEQEFGITDIKQLDEVSYREVVKIVDRYESIRAGIENRLKRMHGEGALKTKTAYVRYEEFLSDFGNGKEIRRRLAILNQIRLQNREQ